MAEDLSEQESPSLQAPEDLSTSNTIKITIDEDEGEETSIEPQQVNSNSVEKEVNSSQVMVCFSVMFYSFFSLFSMITTMEIAKCR